MWRTAGTPGRTSCGVTTAGLASCACPSSSSLPPPPHPRTMCSHGQSADGGYATLNPGAGAKWIKHLTRDRLNNFNGGHFSDVNLSAALFTHRLDGDEHVKLSVWSAPGRSKPGFDEAMKQEFKPAHKGDSFGPSCAFGERTRGGR
jgi:hypothetical protein